MSRGLNNSKPGLAAARCSTMNGIANMAIAARWRQDRQPGA
jgi:hypothetical protein